ncbi:hypothetical protein Tsubulata_041227 [Turnera subulata]|uniref:RRM domain-containing protein n=1 Tax=Turnera subulata TaxID=218843 RepID=A0A9Q0FY36_9ROSI|nr:hypothetical protein Tsubulata_041227 [Turnera subulata]
MDYDYQQQEGQFGDDHVVSFNGPEEEEEEEEEEQQAYYEDIQHQQEQQRDNDDEELGSAGNDRKQSRDSSAGKLFVGGVSWETSEENFASYFSKYGEILDSVIMTDRHSGRPRGFGFVTFADPAVADRVLEEEHVIDGRPVEVKRTVPREEMVSKGVTRTRKIFVGGIPPSLTEDELKEYFSLYGGIIEHQIMLDHKTGRSRGFGFVTFESEDAVEQIFSDGKTHELGGKQVEIKKAEPKRAGGDYGSAAKSSGFSSGPGGYGAVQSSGRPGGKMGRGYGGYGGGYLGYGGYGNYGGGYPGNAAGFYGGYGGYGFGFGFGGPMMYGGGVYGGNMYGASSGYGNAGGQGAGKGYGRTGDGGGVGGGSGRGYGNNGAFSNGKGYGGSGNSSGAANGRHHPYRK